MILISQASRDRMALLTDLCASPWADTPQGKIPEDWRVSEPKAAPVKPMSRRAIWRKANHERWLNYKREYYRRRLASPKGWLAKRKERSA